MCRLYGFHATHPTQPACDLLDAQNALIHQSRQDARGLSNPDGWGLGRVDAEGVTCYRQVAPASKSDAFRAEALRTRGTTVLAHVRRATIGTPREANTHPFRDGNALLAHNGHIEAFDAVRPALRASLPDERRTAIQGDTDSEHFFQRVLTRYDQREQSSMTGALADAVNDVVQWSAESDAGAEVALNTLWSEGNRLAGTRLNRSLWYLIRDEPFACSICDSLHGPPAPDYRVVVLASERITDEDWQEVPNGAAFEVTPNAQLTVNSLDL